MRVCIDGREVQMTQYILTGGKVTRRDTTLRRIKTVWCYRPTLILLTRHGLLLSVVIAGAIYASVKVRVPELPDCNRSP